VDVVGRHEMVGGGQGKLREAAWLAALIELGPNGPELHEGLTMRTEKMRACRQGDTAEDGDLAEGTRGVRKNMSQHVSGDGAPDMRAAGTVR
jgi:hypothetical protein